MGLNSDGDAQQMEKINLRIFGLAFIKLCVMVGILCFLIFLLNPSKMLYSYLDGGEIVPASRMSQWDKLTSLLNRGVDPNKEDSRGRTALNFAARNAPPEIIELLIQKGADPSNVSYSNDYTPHNIAKMRQDKFKDRVVDLIANAAKSK